MPQQSEQCRLPRVRWVAEIASLGTVRIIAPMDAWLLSRPQSRMPRALICRKLLALTGSICRVDDKPSSLLWIHENMVLFVNQRCYVVQCKSFKNKHLGEFKAKRGGGSSRRLISWILEVIHLSGRPCKSSATVDRFADWHGDCTITRSNTQNWGNCCPPPTKSPKPSWQTKIVPEFNPLALTLPTC